MIEISNARLTLGGSEVLRGASLRVAPGEVIALAGANGSGKSTLARMACGAILGGAGMVSVDGADPTVSPDDRRRVRALAGLVQQDPVDQIVSTVVFDEVAFGPRNLGLPESEVEHRVIEALARAGLPGATARDVTALSGGEQQRVALAGVLAMNPRYLVLDEVTSMLDNGLRPTLRAMLARLAHEDGIGILSVTHDPVELAQADRVAVLEEGLIVWEGAPTDLVLGQPARWHALAGEGSLAHAVEGAVRAGADISAVEMERAGRRTVSGGGSAEVRAAGDGAAEVRMAGSHAFRVLASGTHEAGAETRPSFSGDAPCRSESATVSASVSAPKAHAAGQAPVLTSAPAGPAPVPPSTLATLVLQGVSYTYPGAPAPAVAGVDIILRAGEVTLLAGPSGSGKSTIALLAAGLAEPSEGLGELDGAPVRPARVGLAFQRPEAQLFLDTVFDEVAYGPRNLVLPEGEVARRVEAAADVTDLDRALLPRYPFDLSGGQQRRVALSGVVALAPGAYVLDEPTAGLDAAGRSRLRALVRDLTRMGAPVLVISHDIDEWLDVADAVALLDHGRVAWRGPAPALMDDPGIWARVGMAPPDSVVLRALVDSTDPSAPARPVGPARRPRASREAPSMPFGERPQRERPQREPVARGERPQMEHNGNRLHMGNVPKLSEDRPTTAPGERPVANPLGASSPDDAPLASVDARVKIVLLLLITVLMFVLPGWVSIAAGLAGLVACVRLARMNPRAIGRALRPVAVILAFTLLANLISLDGHAPMPLAGPLGLDPAGGLRGAAAVSRIIILLGFSLVVSASTTPPEVCDACVRLMRPLGRAGVPVGDVGMAVSIALRFIPVVAEEFHRIRTAQRARGARFDEGGAVARVRAHAAIMTPLVVGLFRRADHLAESMAARLYDGHVSVPPCHLTARDRAALAIGLICCAAIALASCLVR